VPAGTIAARSSGTIDALSVGCYCFGIARTEIGGIGLLAEVENAVVRQLNNIKLVVVVDQTALVVLTFIFRRNSSSCDLRGTATKQTPACDSQILPPRRLDRPEIC